MLLRKLSYLTSVVAPFSINIAEGTQVEEVRDAVNQLEQGNGVHRAQRDAPGSDGQHKEEDSNKLKKEKLVEQPKQPRITKVNNKLQFKMKDQWAETLFNLKLIVNRLSSRDARTTDKPGAGVSARALESAVVAFRKLEWTPELAKEMRALLAALSDACSKNDVLRLRAQLESLEMNMPQEKSATTTSTKSLDYQVLLFKNLVDQVKNLPRSDRVDHVMASDYTGAHQAEVRHSARAVKHWICAIPFRDELGNVYESYANSFAEYCKKSQLQHQPNSTSHA
ncbi:hypothetical protein PI126_g18430 [Phytophthora idaei]|nr:hypothetical protein PI126_g18430 [Phytophthora idaei]